MRMSTALTLAAAWAGVAASISAAATFDVSSGNTGTFTSPSVLTTGDTSTINGVGNINSGSFQPDTLTINGFTANNGIVNVNGGTFAPVATTLNGSAHLNLLAPGATSTLTNNGGSFVNVDAALTVTTGAGTIDNIATLYTSASGSVQASVFQSTGTFGGVGLIESPSFALSGAIVPGDAEDTIDAGTLPLQSASNIALADVTVFIDFVDGLTDFTADKITIDGSYTLGGNSVLFINGVSDPNGHLQFGDQFVLIDSTSPLALGEVFSDIDLSGLIIDDGLGNEIGTFVPGYDYAAGQVYVTFVPEPGSLGLIAGLSLLGLRRRR